MNLFEVIALVFVVLVPIGLFGLFGVIFGLALLNMYLEGK